MIYHITYSHESSLPPEISPCAHHLISTNCWLIFRSETKLSFLDFPLLLCLNVAKVSWISYTSLSCFTQFDTDYCEKLTKGEYLRGNVLIPCILNIFLAISHDWIDTEFRVQIYLSLIFEIIFSLSSKMLYFILESHYLSYSNSF